MMVHPFHVIDLDGFQPVAFKTSQIGPAVVGQDRLHARFAVRAAGGVVHGILPGFRPNEHESILFRRAR